MDNKDTVTIVYNKFHRSGGGGGGRSMWQSYQAGSDGSSLESGMGSNIMRSTWKRARDSPGLLDCGMGWPADCEETYFITTFQSQGPSKGELHSSQPLQKLSPADGYIILQSGITTICPDAFLEQ